ncbi:hypothetical protein [Roseateles terrae]|uniref:Uncharacterized protein n=1 Tax=Roseateles terrae TaxID=431060 RepID=A0ABR6GRA0_9BURK|nr:hypothetical protein [Roseateles terrae]MBB3194648.1 hypothetical protein [Roseateles terrae]
MTDLKAGLRACRWIDRDAVAEVLLKPFPKHVWVTSFWTVNSEAEGCPVLEVYFDATALRQGGGLLCLLPFNAPDADTFFFGDHCLPAVAGRPCVSGTGSGSDDLAACCCSGP